MNIDDIIGVLILLLYLASLFLRKQTLPKADEKKDNKHASGWLLRYLKARVEKFTEARRERRDKARAMWEQVEPSPLKPSRPKKGKEKAEVIPIEGGEEPRAPSPEPAAPQPPDPVPEGPLSILEYLLVKQQEMEGPEPEPEEPPAETDDISPEPLGSAPPSPSDGPPEGAPVTPLPSPSAGGASLPGPRGAVDQFPSTSAAPRSARALRRAVIWAEILMPPKALRGDKPDHAFPPAGGGLDSSHED